MNRTYNECLEACYARGSGNAHGIGGLSARDREMYRMYKMWVARNPRVAQVYWRSISFEGKQVAIERGLV